MRFGKCGCPLVTYYWARLVVPGPVPQRVAAQPAASFLWQPHSHLCAAAQLHLPFVVATHALIAHTLVTLTSCNPSLSTQPLCIHPQVLAAELPSLVGGLSFKKSMRWDGFGVAYSRPMRWLLALHGSQPITFTYGGLVAAPATRVLRNAGQPEVKVCVAQIWGR